MSNTQSEEDIIKEKNVEVIFEKEDNQSQEDPPEDEWSSLICLKTEPKINIKKQLYEEGIYEPPISEGCTKWIEVQHRPGSSTDSSEYRHPLEPYPALIDPDIKETLLGPAPKIVYDDDGQDLYIALCNEMNEAPCRIFHKGLLTPHINLSYYGISTMGFRAMAIALIKNKIVKSVDLSRNFISLDGCFHFGEMLYYNNTIKEINFHGCRMGPDGIARLVAKLFKNKKLRKINLSSNELTDHGVLFLSDAISNGSTISDIDLSYNGLTEKSAEAIAHGIEYNNRITRLNLSWNSISVPKPFELLALQLRDSEYLVEIDISYNSLNNRFITGITNILQAPNLVVLKLNNNDLSGPAVDAIGDCLFEAKKLKTLDLSSNPLTLEDANLLLLCMYEKQVNLTNLLLDNVYVDEEFMIERSYILQFRKKAVITHGLVNRKLTAQDPDIRKIVFKRAYFLCSKPINKAVHFGMKILELNKRLEGKYIADTSVSQVFKELLPEHNIDEGLSASFLKAFPGPKKKETQYLDIAAMADYVRRLWPEAKLPEVPEEAKKESHELDNKPSPAKKQNKKINPTKQQKKKK